MFQNPTDSNLARAIVCRASTVLPIAREPAGEGAENGKAWHAFKERIVTLQAPKDPSAPGLSLEEARDLAVAEAPELLRDAMRAIPLERLADLDLDPRTAAVEVAFAYDVATDRARELGRGIERDYGELAPTEYAGTIDHLSLVGMDGVRIRDWKSRHAKVAPASRNVQLKKGALNACRAFDRGYADVEIVRIGANGEPWFDSARLNAYTLDSFAFELKDLHLRIESDRDDYRLKGWIPPAEVSDECRYCDRLRYCPAALGMLRALATGEEIQNIEKGALVITPENAPVLVQIVPRLRERLEAIEGELKTYAAQNPVTLPDGSVYGVRHDKGRTIANVALAKQVLAKRLGDAAAEAALGEPYMTLDGIKAARSAFLGPKPPRGSAGKLDEELEKLLHDAGALRIFDKPVVTTMKPKAKG